MQQMGSSSRRSPAESQGFRPFLGTWRRKGRKKEESLMLENDPRARGPAGQVLLRSLKVKTLWRRSLTQEMSVILSFLDQ